MAFGQMQILSHLLQLRWRPLKGQLSPSPPPLDLVLHIVFPSYLVASILLIPVCKVSPMCLYQFQVELCNQLDGGAVKYALTGLQGGFCINFEASSVSLRSASSNMRSALDQPSVINAYPQTEFSSSQIVGPFPLLHFPFYRSAGLA